MESTKCQFEVILEDFKSKAQLTTKELEEFKFTSLDGLRSTIKRIQQDQEAKRRMRHMKRLEPFLKTMETYGKIVEVFANTSETLAFVWVGYSLMPSNRMIYPETLTGPHEMAFNGMKTVRDHPHDILNAQ